MISWLISLVRPKCPFCDEGWNRDYFGEGSGCDCCNPREDVEDGRVWRWRLWKFRFDTWMIDWRIDREMRHWKPED